jgi:alpha-1,6-mannosyltransferase
MSARNNSLRSPRLPLRWHTGPLTSLKSWLATHSLLILGILSLPLYIAVLAHGDFRPRRMEPFFPIFLGLFVFYGLACWLVLRSDHRTRSETGDQGPLITIFLFAIIFNLLLIPSRPNLSDDMYRYIWDGRVQAAGINPYQYPSNAPELAYLRDSQIWGSMNRADAVTIYPPGAQTVFAATWRVFPDSIAGMKLVMIAATLLAGWLLVKLLRALGQPPERVLIFLWSPLLIIEIAHAAHVDALYLPLIVGAFWLRVRSPSDRVRWRYEAAIGVLLGLATLVKLYPVLLVPCLWSVRNAQGKRRWRFALPVALGLTVLLGYARYIQPGVNTLGFLSSYGHEFFNISPHMRLLTNWAMAHGIPWYIPGNYGMPLSVGFISLWFVLFPARTSRQAVLRCFWPIGIYVLINHNLFSWYILWMLPLIAIALETHISAAFAWWVFTGTLALSYTFFIAWKEVQWGIQLQFWPLYILLLLAGFLHIRRSRRFREQS